MKYLLMLSGLLLLLLGARSQPGEVAIGADRFQFSNARLVQNPAVRHQGSDTFNPVYLVWSKSELQVELSRIALAAPILSHGLTVEIWSDSPGLPQEVIDAATRSGAYRDLKAKQDPFGIYWMAEAKSAGSWILLANWPVVGDIKQGVPRETWVGDCTELIGAKTTNCRIVGWFKNHQFSFVVPLDGLSARRILVAKVQAELEASIVRR
jgi:hypothetical protein